MIRRKLYYDKLTGNILAHIPEQSNVVNVRETTIEEDFSTIKILSERNEDSVGLLWLDYGQYSQDFAESNGYRVNPETKEIEFSYPDPNEPEIEQPYQAPLSEQVEDLKQENMILKAQNKAISERADFIEEIIAEMAMQVYQ